MIVSFTKSNAAFTFPPPFRVPLYFQNSFKQLSQFKNPFPAAFPFSSRLIMTGTVLRSQRFCTPGCVILTLSCRSLKLLRGYTILATSPLVYAVWLERSSFIRLLKCEKSIHLKQTKIGIKNLRSAIFAADSRAVWIGFWRKSLMSRRTLSAGLEDLPRVKSNSRSQKDFCIVLSVLSSIIL